MKSQNIVYYSKTLGLNPSTRYNTGDRDNASYAQICYPCSHAVFHCVHQEIDCSKNIQNPS